jgi:hypothetical protein
MTSDVSLGQILGWPFKIKRCEFDGAYHLLLTTLVSIGFCLLMVIPYAYDQYNRVIYAAAASDGRLVIQEYRSLYETTISRACAPEKVCEFYKVTSKTKLIALDYIEQMENASKLEWSPFAWASGSTLCLVLVTTYLISKSFKSALTRFLFILLGFIFIISFVQIVASLPHANYKFYYLFGCFIGLVCAAADYFHGVEVIERERTSARYEAIALQERHKKWTSILGYSLAIISLVVGTISFNALSYIRVVFGDSFILAPMVGIALMCIYVVIVYIIGIIGNIRQILIEIESTIRNLRDEVTHAKGV